MSFRKILGILLIAAGVLGLTVRSVPMPRKSHRADLGPLEIKVKESRRVEVPAWVSLLLVAAGTGILVIENKK